MVNACDMFVINTLVFLIRIILVRQCCDIWGMTPVVYVYIIGLESIL